MVNYDLIFNSNVTTEFYSTYQYALNNSKQFVLNQIKRIFYRSRFAFSSSADSPLFEAHSLICAWLAALRTANSLLEQFFLNSFYWKISSTGLSEA